MVEAIGKRVRVSDRRRRSRTATDPRSAATAGRGDAGERYGRAGWRAPGRSRRRRFWAGLIGGIVGWGLAGLDGGEAGTVKVPPLEADFAAAGTYTTPDLGTVTFGLAGNAHVVRQVVLVADDPIEMVFDRMAAKVTIIRNRAVEVVPVSEGVVSLFEPFSQAALSADGPLEIVREGVGSHLGHACERYRAFGTVRGTPLQASACVTADGIPLVTEVTSADQTIRTQLTELDFVSPDPRRFAVPLEDEHDATSDS